MEKLFVILIIFVLECIVRCTLIYFISNTYY
nr:MAG TPA: hypothetical protein [Caudoviricetes sp.]